MSQAPSIAFSHIGIYVTHMERMEAFYTRFLGFTVTDRGQLDTPAGGVSLVFLSRDPTEHHQIVLATGRPADCGFNTINQISFRMANLGLLRALYNNMVTGDMRLEVSEVSPACHGNALSVYVRDPEGNRLELFVDTPWYVNQPLRVPFDFSLHDEQLWAWAENHAKSLPGFRPREQWVREMTIKMGLA
jgi:catechol-2,3-dioxygenase